VLRLVGLVVLGIAVGVALTLGFQFGFARPAPSGSTTSSSTSPDGRRPPSRSSAKRSVVALGTLEPRHGSVMIGSPLTGFRIRKIPVREGQSVNQGDLLVELDSAAAEEELRIAEAQRSEAAERQTAEIDLAQQRLETANLAVRQAKEVKELELAAQQKRIDVAELKVKQARSDLERLKALHKGADPLVSAQQVEHQQVLLDLAVAEHAAAKVALSRLQQSLDFESQKAEAEQRAATQSLEIAKRGTGLTALDRRIDLARLKLNQTQVVAPSAGTVISIMVHTGETVATQPLVQLADLNSLVCIAEVDVADVPLIQDKRDAIITCRAFQGKKLNATIERIRNLVGSATLRPSDPRKVVDRSVTTVVLGIDAAQAIEHLGGAAKDAATALVGLQVEVEIPL
jgi:HlyD family secretion protein